MNVFTIQTEQFGFLSSNVIVKEGSGSFCLLMEHQDQHRDFQILVLGLMENEVKKGNASKANFAYLTDRVKVNRQQEQVYGTQLELNEDKTSYRPKKMHQSPKPKHQTIGNGTSNH